MTFQASDLVKIDTGWDGSNLDEYDISAKTFTEGRVYLLLIAGLDNAGADAADAVGVPVTSGINWVEEEIADRAFGSLTCYSGTIASTSSEATVVTFPAVQNFHKWYLIELANANATIVQVWEDEWQATSGTVTLQDPIGTNGLAMLFVTKVASLAANWITGAGQIAKADAYSSIFAQYNLDSTEAMPIGTPNGGDHVAIGVEIAFAAETLPTITSVNGGSTVADADAGVTIVGTNFHASANVVTISLLDDIAHSSAIVQTITSHGTEAIDITVELPSGASSEDPIYLFVNNATDTTAGFGVGVTPALSSYLHTIKLEDGSSNDVISETTLGFEVGMSAIKYVGVGATPIAATLITAANAANTATPEFQITWADGLAAVNGEDTISITYDAAVGDIKAVTGGLPLASGTYDAEAAMVCT